MKGKKIEGWTRDILEWLKGITANEDSLALWIQFQHQFRLQFYDITELQTARQELDNLRLVRWEIDQFVADFEELARKANYNMAHPELQPTVSSCVV